MVPAPEGTWYVAGGKAAVGCNPGKDKCKAGETPLNIVELSAFFVQAYETTVGAYAKCVTAGKCTAPATVAGCPKPDAKDLDAKRPVACVDQAQAAAFCGWAYKQGRLPTNAEWEKAARGGCASITGDCGKAAAAWVWGDKPADCWQAVVKGTGKACSSTSQPVASRANTDRSPYLVYDLAGNVREWTADGWDAAFYGKAAAKGKDPKLAVGAQVTVRGGSYLLEPAAARLAARTGVAKGTKAPDLGFRCVVPAK